jgi:GH25 family lysozyme M1 (1,4-beta-N-acetylmuramidase)
MEGAGEVIFNDGSEYRVLANPDAQLQAGRTMYAYRAASSRNGTLYVDSAFDYHRTITAGRFEATLIYQFANVATTPESQASFLADALGYGLQTQEMICLDVEAGGGFTAGNVGLFLRGWLAAAESLLHCKAWFYVPQALATALSSSVTADRIIWAPRYSGTSEKGTEPGWRHDVWQYTDRGFFPGCALPGDTSTTTLTTEAMLARCNPDGFAEPPHGGNAT